MALHIVIASAAAVASSNREALDMGMPVRSHTIVWKLSSDSSLCGQDRKGKMGRQGGCVHQTRKKSGEAPGPRLGVGIGPVVEGGTACGQPGLATSGPTRTCPG